MRCRSLSLWYPIRSHNVLIHAKPGLFSRSCSETHYRILHAGDDHPNAMLTEVSAAVARPPRLESSILMRRCCPYGEVPSATRHAITSLAYAGNLMLASATPLHDSRQASSVNKLQHVASVILLGNKSTPARSSRHDLRICINIQRLGLSSRVGSNVFSAA